MPYKKPTYSDKQREEFKAVARAVRENRSRTEQEAISKQIREWMEARFDTEEEREKVRGTVRRQMQQMDVDQLLQLARDAGRILTGLET